MPKNNSSSNIDWKFVNERLMTVNIKDNINITILIIAYGLNELIKMGKTSIPTDRRGSTKWSEGWKQIQRPKHVPLEHKTLKRSWETK
jgi:hypothetical protein